MGTDVTYNGVTMRNCVTRQWDESVTYDPSATDSIGTELQMTFEGTLHLQDISNSTTSVGIGGEGGDGGNDTPIELYGEVTRRLHQPRRTLAVSMNGENILEIAGPSNALTQEVDNGPKPTNVQLTHITGNVLYRVRFSVKARIVDCDSKKKLPFVVNNRWGIAESMDNEFFITRTISGTMRLVRNKLVKYDDNTASGAFANKYLTVPGLERGFRRESIDYRTDASGLNVSYTVVDRQVHTAPPSEAVKMSGTHVESTNDGITTISQVSLQLIGRPDSSKPKMLQQAIDVADSRLRIVNRNQSDSRVNDFYPLNYRIVDRFGEHCVIDLDVIVKRASKNPHLEIAEIITDRWGQPIRLQGQPDYDPSKNPIPEIHGYTSSGKRDPAVAMLLECYLQSPCDPNIENHAIPRGEKPGKKKKKKDKPNEHYPKTEVTKHPSAGDLSKTNNSLYSNEHREAIYNTAKLTSRYITDHGRVQMPVARVIRDADRSRSERDQKKEKPGPPLDTSVVLSLYGPQTQREVIADFERAGKTPDLPPPVERYKDRTLIGTLMDSDVEILAPIPTADGKNLIYRVRAKYLYAMNRAPLPNDLLRVGVVPFIKGLASDKRNMIRFGDLFDNRPGA